MKIKIPLKDYDKTVIVDEKRRTVTTLLKGNKTYNLGAKFVGVAVCSPNDIYNEEVGRKISYLRAKKALLSAMRTEIKRLIKEAQIAEVHYKEVCDSMTDFIENIKEQVNSIAE